MPIIIDDIIAKKGKTTTQLSPKFFSSDLTGKGMNSGVINRNVNPNILPRSSNFIPTEKFDQRKTVRVGPMKTQVLPLSPILKDIYENYQFHGNVDDFSDMFHAYSKTDKQGEPLVDIYYNLVPQGLVLYIEDLDGGGTERTLYVLYREEIIYVVNSDIPHIKINNQTSGFMPTSTYYVHMQWDYAPGPKAASSLQSAISSVDAAATLDTKALEQWLDDFDVSDAITQQAELWTPDKLQDEIIPMISEMLDIIGTYINNNKTTAMETALTHLATQLRFLETYNIPLETYREIYKVIADESPTPAIAQVLSKQNINLLISNTLDQLEKLKPQLPTPVLPQTLSGRFSPQQTAAITTEEPLVMLQAGAGSGKSTTVLGRIDNLIAGGVNPEDITVLSFTNAAADHISELNPNIGSMTIARMIHDIYCENYKNHNLSSIDTIINSLDIYFPNNQTANMFRRLLLATNKTEPGAITQLNNFIEINFDEVITILDTLGQTSLELEIIIAYQRIDDMIEPAHVKSKYLIIDEVQDNSVFEFIYILKYVAKHKENLYIVGDSSQTLYEFRSANPKALNALEASGIFATFKLTTNYRSNQEILDFANIHLADIEANQYAQIQLQANVLKPITADSFREKVGLKTQHISRVSKVDQELPDIIANNARSYIDRCLAKGQQVAMLAFTRRQVTIMQNTVQEMYPDRKVVNIVSLKSYPTTVFSMFIKKFWDQVTQVDPANAPYVITNQIQKNLKSLTRNYATAKEPVAQMIAQWWKEDQGHIVSWLSAYQSGAITKDQYFERLQKCVLDFEIRHNAIKAALLDEKKKQRKENDDAANADIIVSTIHGVKGLEFENVVLFMQYNSYEKEDTKRMQYVALTRAMHSELILAYSTKEEPGIKDDYEAIITALEENDTRRIA